MTSKNNDLISRSALKEKLQAHHDFFVNAYGGFSNLPQKDKARVDEITNCIAEVLNAPAVDAVELPVMPGRTVWILNHIFPAEIAEICIRKDGIFAIWVEYDRGPELTELWDDGEFDIKEIGKTVFLTTGELEAAHE